MRVCYFGTYRAAYTRNKIMIEGLRRNGVEVAECHEALWHGIEDRVQAASGGWAHPQFWWRVLRTYVHLLWEYFHIPDYDVMVLGYPCQMDVFLARVLTWLKRRPLVGDAFMSIYLVAVERELVKNHRLTGQLIYRIEKLALRLLDRIIVMSDDYITWFQDTYGFSTDRFRLVLTGADERVYHPVAVDPDPAYFTVMFYGTFIYTHGVLTIIEAARQLQDYTDIRFVLIGSGPLKERAVNLVAQHALNNVEFVSWIEPHELPARVAAADICLGTFGVTPQAQITIQNKIYEALAMAKPLLTGDGLTVRRYLTHGEHVYFCKMDDPQSLAEAILHLRAAPALRQQLATEGHKLFVSQFSIEKLGYRFKQHLMEMVSA